MGYIFYDSIFYFKLTSFHFCPKMKELFICEGLGTVFVFDFVSETVKTQVYYEIILLVSVL